MLDDLHELNESFYSLYGRLHENEMLLSKKQAEYIADKAFDLYKREYALLLKKHMPTYESAVFAAEERAAAVIPHVPCWFARIFLRRRMNRAADLIVREVEKAVRQEHAKREKKLQETGESDGGTETVRQGDDTAAFLAACSRAARTE